MKKIILTIVLSSLIPALAIAESKKMQNTHTSASDLDMKGKRMMNTHTSQSDVNMKSKKHMAMADNPFSSHNKKVAKKTKRINNENRGYSVVEYIE